MHRQLDSRARTQPGLSTTNKLLVVIILAGTAVVIAETEPMLANRFGPWFVAIETFLGIVFAIEYAARIWAAAECASGGSAWRSSLRFILSASGPHPG